MLDARIRAGSAFLMVRALGMVLTLIVAAGLAHAQAPSAPILTIDSERFFISSAFGKRVEAEIEQAGAALSAENRKIEAELTAEEQALTAKREVMEPTEFRVIANAFDEKVQQIRRTQDGKARALTERGDADRVAFLRAAQPVLEAILVEFGAGVILERSSVFFSSNSSDITDLAITRIDAAIGDGSALQK